MKIEVGQIWKHITHAEETLTIVKNITREEITHEYISGVYMKLEHRTYRKHINRFNRIFEYSKKHNSKLYKVINS